MKFQTKGSQLVVASLLLTMGACSSIKKESSIEVASVNPEVQAQGAEFSPEAIAEEYNRIPAAECDSSKYKTCKQARKNDIADRYMLGHDGTLFRRINGATCAVDNKVTSFKISQHPNDVAVLYYKKENNDLYIMNQDKEIRKRGECPSAKGNARILMSDVKEYSVVSNTNTTIVNAALSNSGRFLAWDNVNVVYQDYGVDDFMMSSCYKTSKSFSSYVLFTKDTYGYIRKVKVNDAGYYIVDKSKDAGGRYNSISDFVTHQNVCK